MLAMAPEKRTEFLAANGMMLTPFWRTWTNLGYRK
jgi:hypothetical protein